MAYNKEIETRIDNALSRWENQGKKKMFGGICYLINGNMVCGIYRDFLILRTGEAKGKECLLKPYVKPFDITGKPMRGWIMVEENRFKSTRELEIWLNMAKDFVNTLPSK